MILNFAAKNVFSFAEGIEISFRSKKGTPLHLMGLKGGNGAGKTNLLKAIAFLLNFMEGSFQKKPNEPTGVVPFFGSAEPSEFELIFISNDPENQTHEYIYELEVTKNEVLREQLSRRDKRKTVLATRMGDSVNATQEFAELASMKLRKNASFISIAKQNEISCLSDIYFTLQSCQSNVGTEDMAFRNFSMNFLDEKNLSIVASAYFKRSEHLAFVRNFICECDIGISDIKIEEEQMVDGEIRYIPYFEHRNNGNSYWLNYRFESSGTQYLFRHLFFFYFANQLKSFLIFDELDMSLHSRIIPKLLALFDPQKNPNCGQLIFSTHEDRIMDTLGKESVFLLNKDDNESFGYRVDACPASIVRNGRSISGPYLDGKIGGVPDVKI